MSRRPGRTTPAAESTGVVTASMEDSATPSPVLLDEIRRLQKTHALLIAVQFAANHGAEFDFSDAVAAVTLLIEQTLDGLNLLEAAL